MLDSELLAKAIVASKLSARRFATTVIFRNERTVRGWLAGVNDLPKEVRDECLRRLKLPPDTPRAPRKLKRKAPWLPPK